MKKCSKCKINKNKNDFHKRSDINGLRSNCKKCTNKSNRNWHNNNKDSINKRKNEYNIKNYTKVSRAKRNERYTKRYNLTLEKFEQMEKDQNNLCKICNNKAKLVVDHCHKTKKIRGLLCQFCNLGLGAFKDNYNNLNRAIIYLIESVIK